MAGRTSSRRARSPTRASSRPRRPARRRRAAVAPQYDFTPDKAAAVVRQQGLAFDRLVAPVDNAFDVATAEADRIALLETALPGLTDESRANLMALPLSRWTAIRTESARILDQLESNELRDADLAEVRSRLAGRILGGLNEAERKLAAEIVGPLLVANSDFDQAETDAARSRAAELVAPTLVSVSQGQAIVRKGDRVTAEDVEQIDAFGLGDARWDLTKLAGWALFSALLVGLLLAWVWRFRPELWHRTNALALVGLLLVFATFALEITAGRAGLPFIVPTAAVGILVALLLDAGTAMLLTAVIAVVAGAVNGNSLEMTAYVFFGGAAGIVAIRRGDRLNAFVQAGVAIALVDALVVTTFGLLGQGDLTGRHPAVGRLGRRRGRARRSSRSGRSRSSATSSGSSRRSSFSSWRTRRSRSSAGC